jgi:hypothetical protein
VPFELGRPFGAPNEPDFQRRVLADCLDMLNRDHGPVLEDFPDAPPGADVEQHGWACPVNFPPPVADVSDEDRLRQALEQEIALLRPWYEQSKANRNDRTNFGLSGRTPEEIAAFLAKLVVMQEDTPPPVDGLKLGPGFKRLADDLRYYYTEAAIARPDMRASDVEVASWLFGETMLGKTLIAIRDWAMETDEPSVKPLAQTAMVPTHQRHLTKHG